MFIDTLIHQNSQKHWSNFNFWFGC